MLLAKRPTSHSAGASDSVIDAVASREGVDPVALTTPLYEVIDPEGLDRLVDSATANGRSDVLVTFEYYGYDIAVDSDGSVTLS